MPHALLLSPDDQAVSAISGVLEEMSVSCERPLDGVSAAQKLNSRSFDLVLVDCENLPAAKLIFDVCRRGKHGTNPVPIAIVDGRAGLPTAFRLGAELILTKPVAKDQARSTIRTAVGRLRKEEPARAGQAAEPARAGQAAEPASIAAAASTQPEERALAAVATVSSPTVKTPDVTLAAAAENVPAPAMSTAVEATTPMHPPAPPEKSTAAQDLLEKPAPQKKLSEDPVMADLERDEPAPPSAVFSSYQAAPPKGRSPLVATLILALAGGGVYAAWMYQPGFRALVQPQLDRVLALAGVTSQKVAAPLAPVQTPDQTTPNPNPAVTEEPRISSSTDAAQADGSSNAPSASAVPAAPATATPAPASAPAVAKPEAPPTSRKTETISISSDTEMPEDQGAVILSSKGAEKRLLYHVPPTLPKGTTAQQREGTVVLKTMVDNTGKVESVHLVEGTPALADAAIQAVKQWRYRPYVRDGKSLPFQTVVLVDFQRP